LGGQGFENIGVKNKGAMHFGAIFEGVKQGGVVGDA
jgi:hypothetical protein